MNLYNLLEKNSIHLNKDIFHYGLFIMKSYIIVFGFASFITLFLHCFFEMFIFSICFVYIRRYSGGFHFENTNLCTLVSIIFISIMAFLLSQIQTIPIFIPISSIFISVLILIIYGPIENKNKKLFDNEKKVYKKKILFILLIMSIILFITLSFKINLLYKGITLSLIISPINQLLGIFQVLRKNN